MGLRDERGIGPADRARLNRPRRVGRAFLLLCITASLAACAPSTEPRVSSIEIVGFGIFEHGPSASGPDPSSPIGAQITRAQNVHISRQTDRIPLRQNVAYGIAFIVRGSPAGAMVEIDVVLRTSAPCVLKGTGQVVHENESTLAVRIGELRHIGGRIPAPEEDHCAKPPGPGTDTFELFYRGRKLAEKRFQLVSE